MATMLKLLSFIVIIAAAALLFMSELPQLVIQGDVDRLREVVSVRTGEMLLLTFLIMFLQNFITAVPLLLLVTVNVALFGFSFGYIWSWLSSVIAATLVFLLTRYWLQSWLMRKVKASLKDRIERNGFSYVLVCRLIPVMPSSLINMAAGASTIRLSHFLLSTLLGNLLYLAAVAAVSYGFMTAGWQTAILCIVALATAGGFLYWRKRKSALHVVRSHPPNGGRHAHMTNDVPNEM